MLSGEQCLGVISRTYLRFDELPIKLPRPLIVRADLFILKMWLLLSETLLNEQSTVQNLLALFIVAMACAYLAWRGWMLLAARKKAAGCASGCGNCPVGDAAMAGEPQQLVTIKPLMKNSTARTQR